MNPVREIVYATPGYSFCIQYLDNRRLHFNWHYHEDIELVLIKKGEGQIHIGDLVRHYKAPAGFLIGPSLPHGFLSIGPLEGWIIQFQERHIKYPNAPSEFANIIDVLVESKKGLSFSPSVVADCLPLMNDMDASNGLGKWLGLLKVLNILSQDKHREVCSLLPQNQDIQTDPFEQAISQIYNEIDKAHNLEEVSQKVGMKVSTFCKNFKRRYGISFIKYVHSIRINTAKKMLIQTKFYIDDICYESGFNNVSFFNRKFKEATGLTPSGYRKRYREA
jgi:AraC-like DNA-binding protein